MKSRFFLVFLFVFLFAASSALADITGYVVDSKTGAGVEGAWVWAYRPDNPTTWGASTDSTGAFTFVGAEPVGDYEVGVTAGVRYYQFQGPLFGFSLYDGVQIAVTKKVVTVSASATLTTDTRGRKRIQLAVDMVPFGLLDNFAGRVPVEVTANLKGPSLGAAAGTFAFDRTVLVKDTFIGSVAKTGTFSIPVPDFVASNWYRIDVSISPAVKAPWEVWDTASIYVFVPLFSLFLDNKLYEVSCGA